MRGHYAPQRGSSTPPEERPTIFAQVGHAQALVYKPVALALDAWWLTVAGLLMVLTPDCGGFESLVQGSLRFVRDVWDSAGYRPLQASMEKQLERLLMLGVELKRAHGKLERS